MLVGKIGKLPTQNGTLDVAYCGEPSDTLIDNFAALLLPTISKSGDASVI